MTEQNNQGRDPWKEARETGQLVGNGARPDPFVQDPAKAPEPILQFFAFEHLKSGPAQDTSRPFGELARHIYAIVPRNAERTVALRKLLEAKDAAVRAIFAK